MGIAMLNRITVSTILKSAIGMCAAAVVVLLALGAWDSWSRLKTTNKMVNNAEASIHLFAAQHNLRFDRASSFRDLNNEAANGLSSTVRTLRTAEAAAFDGALVALKLVEFPAGSTAVADFEPIVRTLRALQQTTDAALTQPKAQRRAGLADEYSKLATTTIEQLGQLSAQLAQQLKLQDAYVDQLMQFKELGWTMREKSGDAAVLINNTVSGLATPPDAISKYLVDVALAKQALATIESFAVGLPLPANFTDALRLARNDALGQEHTDTQFKILKSVVAGEKSNTDPASWGTRSRAKQAVLLRVAEVALEATKDYAVDQHALAQRNLLLQSGLLAFALIASVLMMLVVSHRITNPLLTVRGVMVRISGGDFNASLPETKREDEIGQIISSVNEMVTQVRTAVGSIKESAREVTNASAEISSSTTDLSQRTEEQAASLEQTSASMEEISATVKKNAENARHASESASATREVADRGGQVVAQAVQAMAKIEDSSRKISDIIGVIDEIARQTNLLALNAAVEAARAGEAGRGFAVVASEVRSLAQRSSQAAKDIKDLITNSNGQVKDGVDLVNKAGQSLQEIVASIKSVADIVADIATASSEQATGIDEVNKALTQMDGVTQQNSALVEENAATAKTLEFQAKSMDDQVAFFKVEEAQEAAPARSAASGLPAAKRPARGLGRAAA
jgi:methyl-accepting chemotaxis protein